MQYVDERPLDRIALLVCPDASGEASGTLYEDAGDGYGHLRGEYRLTTFRVTLRGGRAEVTTSHEGNWPAPAGRSVEVIVAPAASAP